MAKKKNTGLTIFIIILICLFVLPMVGNLTRENEEEPKQEVGFVGLSIIDSEINYRENSMSIDVLDGYVTTSVELDKIFVNVNGIGVQDLSFETVHTQENGKTYVVHTIAPQDDLCMTWFDDNSKITAVLYVEYDGMTYKVSEDVVSVISCWVGPY